jgi:cell division septation protein DedD
MAAKKGGRGEMVLESRHLFGLFILFAVLFGVVFTLGYLLGKGQGDSQPRIAAVRPDDSADAPADDPSASAPSNSASSDTPAAPAAPAASTAPGGTDWSFYHSSDSKPPNDVLEPAPASKPSAPSSKSPPSAPGAQPAAKPATAKSAAPPNSKPAAAVGSPLVPKGALVLQVAAVEKESDALAMAQALQQRKFPAFVLPAGADQYYRVQVGPYATAQAANAAQKLLESQGFKSIVKR